MPNQKKNQTQSGKKQGSRNSYSAKNGGATRNFTNTSRNISSRSSTAKNGRERDRLKNQPIKKKKSKALNIVITVLSVLAIVAGGVFIYADVMLGRMNLVTDPAGSGSNSPLVSTGTSQAQSEVNAGEPLMLNGLYHDDQVMNVLIMGVDDYQKNDIGRSDSMLMVSLDKRHQKLKMTSFMRDMYVDIPGHNANRINTAYSLGGAPLTVQTIESNFAIDIDKYVLIDNASFNKIIDRLGGVTMTITSGEAKLINTYSGETGKHLSAGTFRLTGKQAHYYSRIRAIGDDFERTQRQRKVLDSIINEFKSSNIGTINSILYDVLPLVTTNMDKGGILSLASNALTYLNYPTSQTRIPADGAYKSSQVIIGGSKADVLVPDLKKNSQLAAKFIYENSFEYSDLISSSSETSGSSSKK